MTKLRIAIIGYGYWGPNLVRNFWKNPQCIVTNVIDFDKNRLKAVNNDYPSINTKDSLEKILDDESIEEINNARNTIKSIITLLCVTLFYVIN